jgi:hypothetical protein
MNIVIEELNSEFRINIDNYSYNTEKNNMTKDELYDIINCNSSEIYSILQSQELDDIRKQREEEFSLFDKYQLTLYWNSLNPQQQQDYSAWRNAWLNVTETKIIPNRLDWFKS